MILKDIFYAILEFITAPYVYRKGFIKERYWMHLSYSFALSLIPMGLLIIYFHLGDTPLLFQCFIGGGGAFIVNAIRETQKEIKYGAPFDRIDVYFGTYGGIIATLLLYFIL